MVKLEGEAHKLEVIRFSLLSAISGVRTWGRTCSRCEVRRLTACKGRDEAAAARLREEARAVAEAGAQLLVLECVPSSLAAAITATSPFPPSACRAPGCDGQVLVLTISLAWIRATGVRSSSRTSSPEAVPVAGAVRAYADAVRSGAFPDDAHSYGPRRALPHATGAMFETITELRGAACPRQGMEAAGPAESVSCPRWATCMPGRSSWSCWCASRPTAWCPACSSIRPSPGPNEDFTRYRVRRKRHEPV